MNYPPLTTASLVSYSHLGPFSEVVPAEKMAELERKLFKVRLRLMSMDSANCSAQELQSITDEALKILEV